MTDISESEVARYWDGNSAVWADQVRKGFDIYREVLNNPSMFEMIGSVKGKVVLDVGCGEGHNTRTLARLGAKVVGIDISPKMIELAAAAEIDEPLGISYHACSFSRMPLFKDSTFDRVVGFMSLMDGPDYEEAIREIYRVLGPGGELSFSITHPCFLTEGLRWIVDENGEAEKLAVGNYFKKTPYLDKWKFSSSPESAQLPEFLVPYFPRTLSKYLNVLLVTGFQILEIREPCPSEEDCKKFPTLQRWSKHAAIFLQVKVGKPR